MAVAPAVACAAGLAARRSSRRRRSTHVRLSDFSHTLAPQRAALVVVSLVVFYLSTEMFFQPHLLDFWTPADLAGEWFVYLAELAAMALVMSAAYAAVDSASRRWRLPAWARLGAIGIALYAAATGSVWITAALRHRFAVAPDLSIALAGGLRFAVMGLYLVLMRMLWHRVRETDAAAIAAEADADALAREQQQLRLQLLRSQIEPHFLFNTLANVRRLYRTDSGRGAQMMASLKHYLQAALPGVRRDDATLGNELDLVRAYLALIAMRMGDRLAFDVRDETGRGTMAFAPMVVLTLVENAIKHGIEPSPHGGRIDVRAVTTGRGIQIEVADDGVGIGGAASSGTGVGLRNITSQLQSRYGPAARLTIAARARGVVASIVIDGEPAS